jgi:hypothetical protein
MRYRVRSTEGELEFESFGQMEQAWLMGLVGPDDEVLEEGKNAWRKASTIALLTKAERTGDQVWNGTWFLWVLFGVIGATISLVLLRQDDWPSRATGFGIAFFVAALMFNVTRKAYERRKPHPPPRN